MEMVGKTRETSQRKIAKSGTLWDIGAKKFGKNGFCRVTEGDKTRQKWDARETDITRG